MPGDLTESTPLPTDDPGSNFEWARDGAAVVGATNVGALLAFAFVIVVRDLGGRGPSKVLDAEFVALCAVQVVSGVALGALAGVALRPAWRWGRERWLALLGLGFPIGTAIGVAQALVLGALVDVSAADRRGFLLVGLLAGGALGGPLWATYALLRAAGRRAIGVALLAPHLAAFVTGGVVALVIWLGR